MARSLLTSAALGWVALAICAFGAACSFAFDLDQVQCNSKADCDARGFENAECVLQVCQEIQGTGAGAAGAGGEGGTGGTPIPLPENFTCLDGFTTPDPGKMTHHNYLFEGAVGELALTDLEVVRCHKLDVDCATPEETYTPDENNRIEFDMVTAEEDGYYLKATGMLAYPTPRPIMPTIVYFQHPVVVPEVEKIIRVVDQTTLFQLAEGAGVPIDESRGIAIIITNDCTDNRAAGVRIESDSIDKDTTIFHFEGSFPDPESVVTDIEGAGGLVNMPIGDITARTVIAETGRFIGEANFLSKALHIAYVPIGPTEQ